MKMSEEINSLRKERNIFICMALTFLFILVMVLMFSSNVGKNKNICYDFKSLNETLEDIDNNCDSTFITKRYGKDNWFIYNSNDCKGDYCKSTYIPLEECLFAFQEKAE